MKPVVDGELISRKDVPSLVSMTRVPKKWKTLRLIELRGTSKAANRNLVQVLKTGKQLSSATLIVMDLSMNWSKLLAMEKPSRKLNELNSNHSKIKLNISFI